VLEPLEARVPVRPQRLERLATQPPAANPGEAPLLVRLGGVLTERFHALVATLEDPQRMLRLSQSELEASLAAVQRDLRSRAAEASRTEQARAKAFEDAKGWADKAAFALRKGRDDLARLAVEQELRASALAASAAAELERLGAQVASVQAEAERLRAAIGELWLRRRALSETFVEPALLPDAAAIDAAFQQMKAAQTPRPN
jgi:phage shock protein A